MLKNMWVPPVSRFPEGPKAVLTITAFPIFPAIHAADNWKDFIEFWSFDREDKVKNAAGICTGVVMCSLLTAVWTHMALGFVNDLDRAQTLSVHAAKTNAVVQGLACDLQKGDDLIICGFGEVSDTPYKWPWLPYSGDGIEGERLVVFVERKNEVGFNRDGILGSRSCEVLGYGFIPKTPDVAVAVQKVSEQCDDFVPAKG